MRDVTDKYAGSSSEVAGSGCRFQPGQRVEVKHNGRTVRCGIVAAANEDGSRIWLAQDGVNLRRLFERAEGYEVVEAGHLR